MRGASIHSKPHGITLVLASHFIPSGGMPKQNRRSSDCPIRASGRVPVLAASCAQQAKMAEAHAQVTATLRLRPNFSIETFLQRSILLERAEDRDHLRDGLIKAGFPR